MWDKLKRGHSEGKSQIMLVKYKQYLKILANGQFRYYEITFSHRHFLKKITNKTVYLADPLITIIITDTITMNLIIRNTRMFNLQQNTVHDWFLEEK